MKILTVFYSLTGNTKKIAQASAEAVAGEVMEIKLKKDLPGGKFAKYLSAGMQMMKKESPEIMPFDKNPNDYDLIFLGTPVWGDNFVPAVRSFLAQSKLKNKKIALFCVHGGENAGQAIAGLEKGLAGNEIVGKIDFKMDGITEAQMAENLRKAGEWARGIAGK